MDVIPAQSDPITLSEFEQAVCDLDTFETMPSAAQRILSATADGEAAVDDIYDLVATDPSLAAGAMRIASSAIFGGRPAATLRDALVRLGVSEIRRFVLAQSMMSSNGASDPFHRAFWENSLKCAAISEALAKKLGIKEIDDPFLCGLLHDFGVLILSRLRGKRYQALIKTPGQADQTEHERGEFGFAHTDLGSMVAASWNLFDALEHVMQFHHTPLIVADLGLDPVTVKTVHIVGLAHECAVRGPDSEAVIPLCTALAFDPKKVADACERGVDRYERLYASMLNQPT